LLFFVKALCLRETGDAKKKEKKSPIIILFPLPHKKLNPTQKEESHPQHHHPKMNPE